ncbi:MAG: hypothetical protein ACT4TC_26260 [Myxococcaceae bacterium]
MKRLFGILLLCSACRSTYAPLINHPVGAALQNRAAGSCYAQCSTGYTCDEKTGYCVKDEPPLPPGPVPGSKKLGRPTPADGK